jgi:membrane peptidoglycan carboxypeptidase
MPTPDDRAEPRSILSHLGVMAAVSVIMGVVVAGLAIPFAGVLGITARNMADAMQELPAELETQSLSQRTTILANDGTPIANLYDENRVNISLTEMSKTMRQSIVAIEDFRFYQHGALDLRGTLRALLTNTAAGGVTQGGSSITQQMVKLTLISQAKGDPEEIAAAQEETISRKIRELRYAIAFEEKYSKDWILERYLNIAYFGDGVYGVQAAARHYFSTDAKKLTLPQSAMLAGLVKNPVGYDPTVYPDRAITRRNLVLDRMAELNVITRERAEKVKKRSLGLKITKNRNGCMFSRAPFFCDYVVSYLLRDRSLGATMEERKQLLYSGGLTIQTTLDPRFQDAADASVRKHVYATDGAIGGLAMIEPGSGDVRALAQSRPMGTNVKAGETFLNFTVPERFGGARGFSPGSTFKAFVLAAAIKQGIPLTTSIYSPPEATYSESSYKTCGNKTYGNGSWKVGNAEGIPSGNHTLYTGTQKSVNTFYAQLEQRTGICEPYRLAKKMGVQLDNPRNERVPSFTLGVSDASPLEMAEAYATFAARGKHCAARPVTALRDSSDRVVKKYASECTQVLEVPVADAVNDILRGVQEPGGYGGDRGLGLDQDSAAKTGTAQNAQAVWYNGYTANLATAAMIAGVTPANEPDELPGKTIGGLYRSSASGSGFAGPMWGDAMQAIDQFLEDVDFVKPSGKEIKGVILTVPHVGGMSVDAARRELEKAGFGVSVASYEVDSSYAQGTVAYTSPGAGSGVGSGSTVTIYVSDGTPYVPPPPPPEPEPEPQPTKKPTKKPDGGGGGGGGNTDGGGGGNTDGGGGGGNGGGGNGTTGRDN